MRERSPRDYRELLRSGRWFAALPEAFQERLLAASALRRLQAGERLFSRGDQPSGLFAVLDGGMRVSGVSEAGKEALLTLLEPPGWFGEIAVFDGQPRTHDAVAEGEALLLHVPQAALDQLLGDEPRWWRDLALLMTAKLRLAFAALEESALLPLGVRLARRLVRMAEGYGDREHQLRTVEVSQEQLARMLATSRQSANQLLNELEAKGLIRLSYGTIEILDFAALRRAAWGG